MPDINPVWLSVALALVTIMAGFLYFRAGRKTKQMQYEWTADQALITSSSHISSSDLSVTYKGDAVSSPRVIACRIANTGKVEILETDFAEAISIRLNGGRVITPSLSFQVDGKEQSVLEPESQDDNTIVAPKMLFNPGDSLLVSILIDGQDVNPVCRARIAGAKFVESHSGRARQRTNREAFAIILATTTVAAALTSLVTFTDLLGTNRVPSVINQPADLAYSALKDKEFEVGKVSYRASDLPVGTVIEQRQQNVELERGARIDLVLSSGPQQPAPSVPTPP